MTVLTTWFSGNSYSDYSATPGVVYYYRIQAANSLTGTGSSTYSAYDSGYRAGINSSSSVPTVGLYPNPAQSEITINFGERVPQESVDLVLAGIDGRVYKILSLAVPVLNEQSIDISELPEGFYILRIQNGEEITTHKFQKIK